MKLNLNNISLAVSAGLPKQFPSDRLPQIAFSGRSNVGKSSLVNMLIGRKSMARVSQEPGKTITVNFYLIDGKMYFTDLPGYGYARRSQEDKVRWSSLTDGYFTNNRNIDAVKLVVQLIDSRIGPTEDDRIMIDYLAQTGLPFVIVATKSDKLNSGETNRLKESLAADETISRAEAVILTSSLKGSGKQELWNEIFRFTDRA